MHIYDTFIIGSGYVGAGYALFKGNCIVCEESEFCDTDFYMPIKQFTYHEYLPVTEEGKELYNIYETAGLFDGSMQNVNGFESCFCKFLSDKDIEVVIKCRVTDIQMTDDNIYKVTVISNSGLEDIYARKILNTKVPDKNCEKFLTLLFVTENFKDVQEKTEKVFPESFCEKAFYDGRYALRIPQGKYTDMNHMKLDIYKKWKEYLIDAQILYTAPVMGINKLINLPENKLCDAMFSNPIEAFEAGYLKAKEDV